MLISISVLKIQIFIRKYKSKDFYKITYYKKKCLTSGHIDSVGEQVWKVKLEREKKDGKTNYKGTHISHITKHETTNVD